MSSPETLPLTALDYERAAQEYCRSLPLEHFMEAELQAMQRRITMESFDALQRVRSDVQLCNELLVQYLYAGQLRRVVPDNMVVLCDLPAAPRSSFNIELEPARPLVTLEYVCAESKQKDYEESFQKYEQELRVPYCILFYPERQDLQVYRHDGERYERLEPDLQGRCTIEELQLQVGILDGWMRFWYQGKLLPLTPELLDQMDQQARQLDQQARQLDQQARQLDQQGRQLDQQARQLSDLRGQLDEAVGALRGVVEERARLHGRSDILQQIAAVSDAAQLSRWLAELQ